MSVMSNLFKKNRIESMPNELNRVELDLLIRTSKQTFVNILAD